jgi:hypothetical protein
MQDSALSPQLQTEIMKYVSSVHINEKTVFDR